MKVILKQAVNLWSREYSVTWSFKFVDSIMSPESPMGPADS